MSDRGPLVPQLTTNLEKITKNREDRITSPNNEEVPCKSWCQSDEKCAFHTQKKKGTEIVPLGALFDCP